MGVGDPNLSKVFSKKNYEKRKMERDSQDGGRHGSKLVVFSRFSERLAVGEVVRFF